MYHTDYYWMGGHVMMWIWWILGIVAVVFAVRCALGACGRSGCGTGSALDALKSRYAKGEISRDDFERMKREIV